MKYIEFFDLDLNECNKLEIRDIISIIHNGNHLTIQNVDGLFFNANMVFFK